MGLSHARWSVFDDQEVGGPLEYGLRPVEPQRLTVLSVGIGNGSHEA